MQRMTLCLAGVVAAASLEGCGGDSTIALSTPYALSAPTQSGAAPMFAVSPAGVEATAWVSAPGGGTDGRLYVSTGVDSARNGDADGSAPSRLVELSDTLGPVEAHGESPPKIAYAPDGTLYAIYVVPKVVPGKRFPLAALRLVRSADGGGTWSAPVTVTDDSVFGSHNFHALHAAKDGSVYIAWLDGRLGKSAAYVTRSRDNGLTWEPNQRVDMGESCPCCRTAIATGADGSVYIAWRKVLPGGIRDIVVARSADGGKIWSEPVRVHADDWKFDGCPHAGPAMQMDEQGRLHIVWWTGKEGMAGVYYARSSDGARAFGAPIALGTAQFSRPAHVQLTLADAGTVIAVWDDGTKQIPQVVMRVSRDGGNSFSGAQVVSAPGEAATFPTIALAGNRLHIAWSQVSGAAHQQEEAENAKKDPMAPHGLHAIGESRIVVRSGTLR